MISNEKFNCIVAISVAERWSSRLVEIVATCLLVLSVIVRLPVQQSIRRPVGDADVQTITAGNAAMRPTN